MTIRALIIDDEPLARRRLRTLLTSEADIEVVGECDDGASAIVGTRRLMPDLLFLDIQMPGLDGFDVLEALGPATSPAVIFVTAHDDYALRAFDVHAVDYLLKPFDRSRLRQALSRVRAMRVDVTEVGRRLLALVADVRASRSLERLVVKSRGRVYFVRVEEIDWIQTAGHYLVLHVAGQEHLIRETFKTLEQRLDPDRFVRVHRSIIVNIDRIRQLAPTFHGEYELELRDGTRLASGRGYSERLQAIVRGR
jgi:two-component system, LytTR family, response regulator